MKKVFSLIAALLFLVHASPCVADPSVSSSIEEAVRLLDAKKTKEAVSLLVAMHGANPGEPAVYRVSYLLGAASMKLENWEEAVRWFEKARAYPPLADYAMYQSGQALTKLGMHEEAGQVFSSLAGQYPPSRWRGESLFLEAGALFKLMRYTECRQRLDALLREKPGRSRTAAARLMIAQCLERQGLLAEAHAAYKVLWLEHPASSDSTEAERGMKRLEASMQPVPLPPSIDERYARADRLYQEGAHARAASELTAILADADAFTAKWRGDASLKRGHALFSSREYAEAVRAFSELSGSAKNGIREEALFMLARSKQRSGDRAGAALTYERLAAEHPDSGWSARAAYNLGDMAESDGDTRRAGALYREVHTRHASSSAADEAMWKEGWVRYIEGDHDAAIDLFDAFSLRYPSSKLADSVAYWSGRALEQSGRSPEARARYEKAVTMNPLSYYSALASVRLRSMEQISAVALRGGAPVIPPPAPLGREAAFHFEKGRELELLGFLQDAANEYQRAGKKSTDPGRLNEIAGLLFRVGDYYNSQLMAVSSLAPFMADDPKMAGEAWRLAFPMGYVDDVAAQAKKNALASALILAVMREESHFRPGIVSGAGAMGLMQVMPQTARKVSKDAGIGQFTESSLYDAGTNITVGSRYLRGLMDDQGGNIPLVLAAYNAGPSRVAEWTGRYGSDEFDVFIERIPFTETRNYVKKVLRSYWIYERLYGDREPAPARWFKKGAETS